jgi:hypothetical protein
MCDAFCCGGPNLTPRTLYSSDEHHNARVSATVLWAVWDAFLDGPMKAGDLMARFAKFGDGFYERQIRTALWDLLNEGCLTLELDWTIRRNTGRTPGVPVKWDEPTQSYK